MKAFRNPATIATPLAGYSHQVEITHPQRWLVISGQVGMHPDGSMPESAAEQYEIALANIDRNLQAAGMIVSDLFKLNTYLAEPVEPARRRQALSAWLGEHAPCMTLVYVSALANPLIKVEIEAWACA